MEIEVPESEVVDRITILELKAARLDGDSAAHASFRLAMLTERWQLAHGPLDRLAELPRLRQVNARLWEVEDALRDHEARSDFGDGFVALARAVYGLNDERAALKRTIDARLGSRWQEVKGYGVTRRG